MTHRACRSRARTGHLTATGPVTRLVRAIGGAEQRRSELRSEKPWSYVEGRGFDSRHLHHGFFPKAWDPFTETRLGKNPQLNHVGPGLTTGPHVRPGCASRSARW